MFSCFISYAWDDEETMLRVKKFADDLKGIEVILDQNNNVQLGSDVDRFMNRLYNADYVLVIGTPMYKEKITKGDSKLSSEWDMIIKRLELDRKKGNPSVIPVLLKGTEEDSFPTQLVNKLHIDFVKKDYQQQLERLLFEINKIDSELITSAAAAEEECHVSCYWRGNTITDTLKMNPKVYKIFTNILKCSGSIMHKYSWQSKAPLFSKDYETTLGAYLYFFKPHKFPESLSQIPESEIEALIIGTAIEILSCTAGLTVDTKKFIHEVKTYFEDSNPAYRPDIYFWNAVEYMIISDDSSFQNNTKCDEVTLSLNNKGRLSISMKDIPVGSMAEMVNVLNVCSLFMPTCEENTTASALLQAKLKLQKNVRYINSDNGRIVLKIGSISESEFFDFYNIFFRKLPECVFDSSGCIKSKWVYIHADVVPDSNRTYKANNNNLSAHIEKLAEKKTGEFLKLKSAFQLDYDGYVELALYDEIVKFSGTEKTAMFAIGPSGSGKTKTIQNFIKNNTRSNDLIIPLSPKCDLPSCEKGLGMFIGNIISTENDEISETVLKNISSLLEIRGQRLIFILDGLNEIDGDLSELSSNYKELLNLADLIGDLSIHNIKLIMTCRDNAFLQYESVTLRYPNPQVFYCKTNSTANNATAYYQITGLTFDEQTKIADMYFKNDKSKKLFVNYLSSNSYMQKEFAHPYLIAVAGYVFDKEMPNEYFSIGEIFSYFAASMLKRLQYGMDIHMAQKLINKYIDLLLGKNSLKRKVTQFILLDCFDSNEKEYASRVLNDLYDINVLAGGQDYTSYLRFTHDRIEEYFIGEYIFLNSDNPAIIEKAIQFASTDQIFFSGVQNYFNKCVNTEQYEDILSNVDKWYGIFPMQLPLLLSEALKGLKINKWKNVMRCAKNNTSDFSKFIWLLITGLERSIDSVPTFMPNAMIENLSQLSSIYTGIEEHLPYLFYVAAKFYFTKDNDYDSCEKYCNLANEKLRKNSNEYYANLVNFQKAIMLRKKNEVGVAVEQLGIIRKNFEQINRWDKAIEATFELGGALRDQTHFSEALELYKEVDMQRIGENNLLFARLHLQMGTIYKNIMQQELRKDTYNKEVVIENFDAAMKNFEIASCHLEESANFLLQIMVLTEQTETVLKGVKVLPEKEMLFYTYHEAVEQWLSYFPVPDRLIPYLRNSSSYAELKGDIPKAIKYLQQASQCAIDNNLGFREFECTYHLGHLIERQKHSLGIEEINLGITALEKALSYNEDTKKYKENCMKTLEKLLSFKQFL